ncbi:hypothetical protein BOTBODRAFT_541714 [Botryobasidium botryosum FD-172 SS1]|uniref:Uncharacterized protein n=1 Tax=Botryobasidium botryosum (strain FD-172 SS1) TaxID=930990 RepID=A0A067N283_BOTB1|nr:hypothetical protein BOTBODRAFT_541714 [Botryobasidium botryosum FD-172 SS1]
MLKSTKPALKQCTDPSPHLVASELSSIHPDDPNFVVVVVLPLCSASLTTKNPPFSRHSATVIYQVSPVRHLPALGPTSSPNKPSINDLHPPSSHVHALALPHLPTHAFSRACPLVHRGSSSHASPSCCSFARCPSRTWEPHRPRSCTFPPPSTPSARPLRSICTPFARIC